MATCDNAKVKKTLVWSTLLKQISGSFDSAFNEADDWEERGGLWNVATEYLFNLPQLHSEVLSLLSLWAQGFAVITSWLDLMKLFPLKYRNDKQPLKVAVVLLNPALTS